jgi:uncharacterized protein with PQ loop repeat
MLSKNMLASILSVVIAVIPQLLQVFDNKPTAKIVLTCVGLFIAAALVEVKKTLPKE